MSICSIVASGPDSASTCLRQAWQDLLAASDDPFKIYQSPEWFDLVRGDCAAGRDAPSLAIQRDSTQKVVGIVPLDLVVESCSFPLVFRRVYEMRPERMIQIRSGRPLLPPGDSWFDELFASLAQRHPDRRIVRVNNVPVPSPFYTYIENSPILNRHYCAFFIPPGLRQVHTIPLPPTYDEFMAKYGSKKRYNIRRQLRQLDQHTRGRLELRRYESADDATEFFDHWSRLITACGKLPRPSLLAMREDRIRRMGELGLLHSYILMDGPRPIAGIYAQRHGPVVLFDMTLHDQEYGAYSPGTCLLHNVVEQLIDRQAATLINFAYGGPGHEYGATNVVLDYVSYWLIPRTWKSRLFQIGYSNFKGAVAGAKAILRKRTASRGEPIGEAPG